MANTPGAWGFIFDRLSPIDRRIIPLEIPIRGKRQSRS
jgi:hypothetical protein